MRIITWNEAFLNEKGLSGLRNDWKLNIPQEYINSTRRYMIALFIWGLAFGLAFGYLFWGL